MKLTSAGHACYEKPWEANPMLVPQYPIGGGSETDSIVPIRRGATVLLNSVSRTTLAAFSLGLALGVALPREARAGAGVVSPVQSSMYVLGAFNPIPFGAATQIDSSSVAGVYGG